MKYRFTSTLIFWGLLLSNPSGAVSSQTELVPQYALDILQQSATHTWMIESIELNTESVINDINDHLTNGSYSQLGLILGNCLSPVSAQQEVRCQNIFNGLAGVSDTKFNHLIKWQTGSPTESHAQFIFALSLHNQALLYQAAATQFGNPENDIRLYQLYESAALMELDQIIAKVPDYSYAVALKFNILAANPNANKLAIEQLINHSMTWLPESWLAPSSALNALSSMESRSFLPIEKFVYFWQQKNSDEQVNDLLAAKVKLIKARSYYLGHPEKPSKKLAEQLIQEAFDTGLRTPEILLLMSDKKMGKAISSEQSAWKYAAYLSAPKSVANLLELAKLKSIGNSEESYWYSAQLATLNTDHLFPNLLATIKAVSNKNELAATPLFDMAFQQSMIAAELLPLAKKLNRNYLYTDILVTKYLLHSLNIEMIYMEFNLDYLQKSRYISRKGISIGELFMVYPIDRFSNDIEDAINDSPLTRDQMILLANIENGDRKVISFPERSQLQATPELRQQLNAASSRMKNNLISNLKAEYDQYVTEMDGLCLADCKWKTSD